MELRKIVVPTDFSDDARAALDVALDLARPAGASVTLLHVCHMPTHIFSTAGMFAPTVMDWMIDEALEALVRDQAQQRARGDYVDIACVAGDPRDAIVAWADEQEADLIVMGTHGRRGLRRLLAGSVAARVLRTSTIPVLTVHAGDRGTRALPPARPVPA